MANDKREKRAKGDKRELKLRGGADLLRAQNPNYFGNLTGLDELGKLPEPVEKKIGDTAFEELTCLGYNPDTRVLTAIVRVKQGAGYSGGPCTPGSHEFVRFYLDYGPGGWVDHGAASFVIHDLGFPDDLCYAVSIRIDPKRTSCCDDRPVLPRVRAILSWNDLPPANMPNWPPVWGNVLERDIQIHPKAWYKCLWDKIHDLEAVQLDPEIVKKLEQAAAGIVTEEPDASVVDLVKQAGKEAGELHVLRSFFPVIAKAAKPKESLAALKPALTAAKLDIDLSKFDDFVLKPAFNTYYEELTCVGYDRDASQLHGIVEVKRPLGYSGGLCKKGSREYIAFYLDFGSGWEYQGTTSVNVHDIQPLPKGGLWYQAALPVDLDEHRKKWCETGRAKIRGILSWATPPTPFDPDYIAHWGDWEECWLEIRPLPKGVHPGVLTPVLETIGGMGVDLIDGAGYADGPSVGGTFTADDSPFGGRIKIGGIIAFPGALSLQYRVMVKEPSDAVFKPWTKKFTVNLATTTFGGTVYSTPDQIAAGDWFDYLPVANAFVTKSVADDLLAVYQAGEEGLHLVYVEVRDAGTHVVLASSAVEAFMVDNTAPSVDVEITSGAGNCGKFAVGDVIEGTFAMSDLHARSLTLSVTPTPESGGGTLEILTAAPAGPMLVLPKAETSPTTTSVGLSYAASELPTGGTSGTWRLTTTGMTPCGYNIRLEGVDRTIVNSGFIGWHKPDIEGFCVEFPEP